MKALEHANAYDADIRRTKDGRWIPVFFDRDGVLHFLAARFRDDEPSRLAAIYAARAEANALYVENHPEQSHTKSAADLRTQRDRMMKCAEALDVGDLPVELAELTRVFVDGIGTGLTASHP